MRARPCRARRRSMKRTFAAYRPPGFARPAGARVRRHRFARRPCGTGARGSGRRMVGGLGSSACPTTASASPRPHPASPSTTPASWPSTSVPVGAPPRRRDTDHRHSCRSPVRGAYPAGTPPRERGEAERTRPTGPRRRPLDVPPRTSRGQGLRRLLRGRDRGGPGAAVVADRGVVHLGAADADQGAEGRAPSRPPLRARPAVHPARLSPQRPGAGRHERGGHHAAWSVSWSATGTSSTRSPSRRSAPSSPPDRRGAPGPKGRRKAMR